MQLGFACWQRADRAVDGAIRAGIQNSQGERSPAAMAQGLDRPTPLRAWAMALLLGVYAAGKSAMIVKPVIAIERSTTHLLLSFPSPCSQAPITPGKRSQYRAMPCQPRATCSSWRMRCCRHPLPPPQRLQLAGCAPALAPRFTSRCCLTRHQSHRQLNWKHWQMDCCSQRWRSWRAPQPSAAA